MIPLLIGIVCLIAVVRLDGGRIPGGRAVPWMAAIAGLVLLQLWAGSGRIDPYRITLLGFRYDLAAEPAATGLTVGGDEETADVWAPGAGLSQAGRIEAVEVEGGLAPAVMSREDGGAVLLVRAAGGRAAWQVVGGRPLGAHDTVFVPTGSGATARLLVGQRSDSLRVGSLGIAAPWLRQHVIQVWAPQTSDSGSVPATVPLEGVRRSGLSGVVPRRPSVFQRTYPISDVLAAAGLPEGGRALGSFLYYQQGALYLADLDSELTRSGDAEDAVVQLPDGMRLMVAGLPHRDHPEEGLTPPSRYGVRPLRTFRARADGSRLDLLLVSREVRSLDRAWLEGASLSSEGRGSSAYRVRFSGPATSMARSDLSFRSVPVPFRAGSHAVLSLNLDPSAADFGVVTPGGGARWKTGRPVALGAGDRALLLRVDGQTTGPGFWMLHLFVFLVPMILVAEGSRRGSVMGLAVLGSGFASIRLLMAWSAHLTDPFVAEGVQLGLWLVAALPPAVVAAADFGAWLNTTRVERRGFGGTSLAQHEGEAPRQSPNLRPPRHRFAWAGGWTGLAALTVVLFADSLGRTAILLTAVIGLWTASWVSAHPGWRKGVRWAETRFRWTVPLHGSVQARPRLGLALGAAFLSVRVLLDLFGWREGIEIGGTRVAVSAGYTPAVLLATAWLLVAHGRQLTSAETGRDRRVALAGALVSVGAFLVLAVLAVSLWISDFGIALVGLPGLLLGLAVLGTWWSGGRQHRPATVLITALPLALFITVQAAPGSLRPLLEGDGRDAASRMADWNRNELLLLERGDPQGLGLIGQRRSEALAVMRETMRSYTRGNVMGQGFMNGRVTSEIRPTVPREHAVGALLASQWGLPGILGLLLLLTALLVPAGRCLGTPPATRLERGPLLVLAVFAVPVLLARVLPGPWGLAAVGVGAISLSAWVIFGARDRDAEAALTGPVPTWSMTAGALLLFGLAGAGIYMVLANYGMVFFTGKNVYLLGIDSVSDIAEGTILLAGAAVALSVRPRSADPPSIRATPARLANVRVRPALTAPRERVEVDG